MPDADLDRLNSIIPDALAAGKQPAAALAELDLVLSEQYIDKSRIVFGTSEATEHATGRVLLGESADLATDPGRRLAAICGAGVHYNGMFGDCSLFEDENLSRFLLTAVRPPAPVSEQVLHCIKLLGAPEKSSLGAIHDAVQRHLSSILLEYPVLMHPAFMVPRWQWSSNDYRSVTGAIAMAPQGSLPRYSHFHRGNGSVPAPRTDIQLLARLKAFATHPCTQLAFNRAGHRIHADAGSRPSIKTGKESLLRSLLSVTGPHPSFLASVMEIDELALSTHAESWSRRPFWAAASGQAPLVAQLDSMLARSMTAAAGLIHTPAADEKTPAKSYSVDIEFLTNLRNIKGQLFKGDGYESDFGKAIARAMQRSLFLGNGTKQAPLSSAEVAFNVRATLWALCEVGLARTPQEAGRFVIDCTLGPRRPDANLPPTDATGAVAFLHALDQSDALATEGHAGAVRRLNQISADLNEAAAPTQYRADWLTACSVLSTERVMQATFERATSATASIDPQGSLDLKPPASRRRSRIDV